MSVRTTTAADAMAWMDLTVPYLDDSQNPDRDHVLFAFVMAVRAALGEAWGELDLFEHVAPDRPAHVPRRLEPDRHGTGSAR